MVQNRTRIEVDPITPGEWAKVRPHLPEWMQLLMDLLMATGLRVSEALAIQREGITWDGARWIVPVQRVKGGKLDQLVVSDALARRLKGHRRRGHVRDPRVFPYSKSAAQKALANACVAAGIRHLYVHQSRHSFAMAYARRRLNISHLEHRIRLRDLLGHKSLESVEPYFESTPEDRLGYWTELAQEQEPPRERRGPVQSPLMGAGLKPAPRPTPAPPESGRESFTERIREILGG